MDLTKLLRLETNSIVHEGIAGSKEPSAVIEQAKGYGQAGFSAQEAFDEVSRCSQQRNRKVRDIAADNVHGLDAGHRSDSGTEAGASANT